MLLDTAERIEICTRIVEEVSDGAMGTTLPDPAAERECVSDEMATVPLATIAWRATRAWHQARRREAAELHEALIGLADDVFRLRKMLQPHGLPIPSVHRSRQERDLEALATRLEQGLLACGLQIVVPEGEMFSGHWTELFESVAQVSSPDAQTPLLTEVISPALLIDGELARRGQAVVTVPEARTDDT